MESAKRIFWGIIEFVFPRDEEAVMLDKINAEELLAKAAAPPGAAADGVVSILRYEHPLARRLIWLLKYEGNKRAAELCAELALEAVIEEASELALMNGAKPLLIPIPLSSARLRERGYNQALLIAEAIMRNGGAEFFSLRPDTLIKTKDTPSQTKTPNRAERLKNLADCFAVREPKEVSGKNIFLLDDVTTTGATFAEAKKTLLAAGARSVQCIAIAH